MGWYAFQNSCYKFMVISPVNRGHNWNDAHASCLAYEGDLLSVGNKLEMDFINEISARFAYQRQHLWIGLNDLEEENKFVWSDGTHSVPLCIITGAQVNQITILKNTVLNCLDMFGMITHAPRSLVISARNRKVRNNEELLHG